MWLSAKVNEFRFGLEKHQYEIKLKFLLSSICISENLWLKEDIIINEHGKNLCEVDIDVFDLYSPNIQDSEIVVNVRFSKLFVLFDPKTINDTFKFFRNTKSYLIKDIESENVRLMDESEGLIDKIKN
jgi:hypothetical protein